jgi:hypothetical protein
MQFAFNELNFLLAFISSILCVDDKISAKVSAINKGESGFLVSVI